MISVEWKGPKSNTMNRFLIAFALMVPVLASWPPEIAYTAKSPSGDCFVSSFPGSAKNPRSTIVGVIEGGRTNSLWSFPWYTPNAEICRTSNGVAFVIWPPGQRRGWASEVDTALTFFLDGNVITNYSNLALARSSNNVFAFASGHTLFQSVKG